MALGCRHAPAHALHPPSGMAPGQTAPCGLSAPQLCSAAARARFLCRTEKASLEPSSKAVNARHHALRNLDAGAHAACLGTPWQSTNGCLSELPAGSWEGPPTSLRSPSCKPPPIAHFSCPAHCSSAWPGRSKLPCGGALLQMDETRHLLKPQEETNREMQTLKQQR